MKILIFFLLPTNSNEQYNLEQYFDKYPDVLTNVIRGNATQQIDQSIKSGMTAYTNDNFEKAIQNLEAIPKHSQDHEASSRQGVGARPGGVRTHRFLSHRAGAGVCSRRCRRGTTGAFEVADSIVSARRTGPGGCTRSRFRTDSDGAAKSSGRHELG